MNINRFKKIAERKLSFVAKPLANVVANKEIRLKHRYSQYYETLPIAKKTILFEARDGQSFTGNPYALYQAMINDARFDDYHFYWVYKEEFNLDELKKNFLKTKNTSFVVRDSDEYIRCLASCQYVITNSTFRNFYVKKEGQVYINTWHGTPLKKMGYDLFEENPFSIQNVARNLLMTDYLVSPNEQTTDMFLKSYKLNGLYQGTIIEAGYPRIDLTLNTPKELVLAKLSLAGIKIDYDKPTILYTPTWKGSNYQNPTVDIEQMLTEVQYLRNHLVDYNVLIKVHPFVYPLVKDNESLQEFLVPDYYEVNEIMRITDVLITDYSSIFFDFLVTKKPIIFYAWDKDLYANDRGMYFTDNQLPGPVLMTMPDVVDYIDHIADDYPKYQTNYQLMAQKMVPHEDDCVSQRYLNEIFFDEIDESTYHPTIDNDKHTIILFPGTLQNNGITVSALSLLDNIDYDKYDVTVFCSNTRNKAAVANLKKINAKARVLFRFGYPDYTLEEMYADQLLTNRSLTDELQSIYPEKGYQRESRRLSGCSHFDTAIDFSGYSYYWSKYMAEMDADRKIVYQHNDLAAECDKVINGKRKHFIALRGQFSLYQKYDVILSASKAIRDVNRAKLVQYADYDKFQYSENTLDIQRIKQSQAVEEDQSVIQYENYQSEVAVDMDCQFEIIKDLHSVEDTEMVSFVAGDVITAINRANYHGKSYLKVLHNHLYIGWMHEYDFTSNKMSKAGLTVVKTTDCDEIAVVALPGQYGAYQYPAGTMENNVMITTLHAIKDACVHIVQKAVLQNNETQEIEEHYHFTLDGYDMGWANRKAFVQIAVERLNHFTTIPQTSVSMTGMARLSSNAHYYVDPLTGQQLPTFNHSIVEINWKMTTIDDTYYRVMNDSQEYAWVSEKDLELLDNQSIALSEQDIHERAMFKAEYAAVYADLADIEAVGKNVALKENKMRQMDTEEIVTVTKYMLTLYGEFVYVSEQQAWVSVADLKAVSSQYELTDISGRVIEAIDEENLNFVSMGRLSPEKNQLALIEAVGLLLKKQPQLAKKFRLYILGNGVLKKHLLSTINQLQLQENVILLGQVDQPFDIMKQCKCFIFPSIYEGQGLALIEALILGLDCLATDIPTSCEILKDNEYGLLIKGTDAQSIAEAMEQYLTNDYHFKAFDYQSYNQKAIQHFYEKL